MRLSTRQRRPQAVVGWLAVVLLAVPAHIWAQTPDAPVPTPTSASRQVPPQPSAMEPLQAPRAIPVDPGSAPESSPSTFRSAESTGSSLESGLSAPANPQTSAAYVLKPADLVQVSVFQEEELSTRTRLAQDGTIRLPMLGAVKLSSLTVNQGREHIRALLDDGYLVNPQVDLVVLEYTKQSVSLNGQVNRPGVYEVPVEGSLSLADAVSLAGGYTRIANRGRITVRRKVGERVEVIKVNAKDLEKRAAKGAGNSDFMLMPGDIVEVGENIF